MTTPTRHAWPRSIAIVLILAYCLLFLVNPQPWFPKPMINAARAVQGWTMELPQKVLLALGVQPTREWKAGIYFFFIAGAIPLLASRLAGRKLREIGWRTPNRFAIRYFFIGVVISAPFLIWMVQSPTMAGPYIKQLERIGAVGFCGFYLVNMLTEHLLLHGVVLGLSTPDGRWPEVNSSSERAAGFVSALRWLGFSGAGAQTHSISGWLGLPHGCLLPMLLSAFLFGGVHLGKDTRELILSFPGGLAQAYIAFRSNSWLTPFAIHVATASTALGMMLWLR